MGSSEWAARLHSREVVGRVAEDAVECREDLARGGHLVRVRVRGSGRVRLGLGFGFGVGLGLGFGSGSKLGLVLRLGLGFLRVAVTVVRMSGLNCVIV